MKRIGAWLLMMCLLAACSDPDQGPPLGAFAAIKKAETDPPFNIVPPSSRSPAPFTFTSSNPAVATISGSLVTIKGLGETTITAAQAGTGGWGPTSASTTLTVGTVASTCVAPATVVNNQCTPPASDANLVTANFLAWSGVSFADNWNKASAYCAVIVIQGRSGWRQPSVDELKALYASGALVNQNWTLGNTWSSTKGATANSASHMIVNLSTGAVTESADTAAAYITCVR